jgi:glycosyltransferase involved in cell wall biosynthesis
MPFFSLICPIFNTAEFLRECLGSVKAQRFREFECFCVDDGSRDGSGALLEEQTAQDPRFIAVHKAHAGTSAARNAAVELSRGEYVAFVDSDDYFCDEWLAHIHSGIQSHYGVDWVRTHYRDWLEGQSPADAKPWPKDHFLNEQSGYCEEIGSRGFQKLATLAITDLNIYRRENLKSSRFPVGTNIGEDFVYFCMLLKKVHSLLVIEDDSCRYRIHQNSTSHSPIGFSHFFLTVSYPLQIWEGLEFDPKWSTYWLRKFFLYYLSHLTSRAWKYGLQCRDVVSKIRRKGWFDLGCLPTRLERARWRLFLMTGIFQFFYLPSPTDLLRRCLRKVKKAVKRVWR